MDEDVREALVDELMALVDFGQAIEELYVQMAAERCLRIIGAEDYLHEEEDPEDDDELYVGGLEEKLKDWVPIVNPITWQILRILEDGRARGIRDLQQSGFKGSPSTLLKYVEILEEKGFVSGERESSGHHRRMIKLAEKGERALEWIDELGELIKEEG